MSKIRDHQSTQPAIRFKGFTDAWEKRRLSEIVTEHNSGVYIAKDEYGSGTNIIGVGDIYESDLVDGQVFRLAPVKDEKFILHSRDLLYGESSLVQEGIARVVSVTEKGAGTAFAWHTRRFVVEPAVADSQFVMLELNYWFPAREHLMRTATKTALTGITTQDFFSTNILVPILFEQKKICDLVHRLDNLITVNQRKGDVLQNFKKALLQRLFASETSPIPDIRFKGFTDAWEKRKLLGLTEKIIDFRGRTPRKLNMHWSDSGYLALSALNVKMGYIDQNADAHFGNEILYQKWMGNSELQTGDVILTTEAPLGNVFLVGAETKFILSQRTIALRTNKSQLNPQFLAVLLSSPIMQTNLRKLSTGGTALGISQKNLKFLVINLPTNILEQQAIGSTLMELDSLIAATQRKGEVLKNLKKALLQKMFV